MSAPKWNLAFRASSHALSSGDGTNSFVINTTLAPYDKAAAFVIVHGNVLGVHLNIWGRTVDQVNDNANFDWILLKRMTSVDFLEVGLQDYSATGTAEVAVDCQGSATAIAETPNTAVATGFFAEFCPMEAMRLSIEHASDTSTVDGFIFA